MRFKSLSLLFILGIFISLILKIPLFIALLFGLFIFYIDGYTKGISHKKLWELMAEGLKTVLNLIIIFTLLGLLTAGWRMSNTIPYLVYQGSKLINPRFFYLISFLLSLAMSMLLGSVNGTVTTMGIVLINLARLSGVNLLVTTGAILSGAMFGDRASPVSSSAALVADLTKTDIVENRKIMLKSSLLPLIISGFIYLLFSMILESGQIDLGMIKLLSSEVEIRHISIIPALLVIGLAILGFSTKKLLIGSILTSYILAILAFDYPIDSLLKYSLFGVDSPNTSPVVSTIVSGGGVASMLSLILNVSISAMIFGIFKESKFLDPVFNIIDKMENRISRYGGIIILSIIFSIVFCTQALVVMVINDLYKDKISNSKDLMLDIENGPIVIPALIPWNLAANAAFVLFEVSYLGVVFNVFCIVLPLYHLIYRRVKGYKR